MDTISTKVSIIVQSMKEYNNIPVRYISADEVKRKNSFAICRTPKQDYINEEFAKAHILLYDTYSDELYEIAKEVNPVGTEYIMNMIRNIACIKSEIESIYYVVFVLLHEVGHYKEYMNNPTAYNELCVEESENNNLQTVEEQTKYRNRLLEKHADNYALDRIVETVNYLNRYLFRGLLY